MLGLALAAALAAGVLWVRGRSPVRPDVVPESGGPSDGPLDVTASDGTVRLGDLAVVVSAPQRPLRAMTPFRLDVRFLRGGTPVAVEGGRIAFTMRMDMGPNDYRLIPAGTPGSYRIDATLPACPSGGRRWFGDLQAQIGGAPIRVPIQLDLAP